jgi:hypothetical protein
VLRCFNSVSPVARFLFLSKGGSAVPESRQTQHTLPIPPRVSFLHFFELFTCYLQHVLITFFLHLYTASNRAARFAFVVYGGWPHHWLGSIFPLDAPRPSTDKGVLGKTGCVVRFLRPAENTLPVARPVLLPPLQHSRAASPTRHISSAIFTLFLHLRSPNCVPL